MTSKTKKIFKHLSLTVIANGVSFLVSSLVILVVPKFISTLQYGCFQLYVFYVGYIGFINFGWPEGIMLRYGGSLYEDLDKKGLKTQFTCYSIISACIGIALSLSMLLLKVIDNRLVYIGVGLCIVVYLPRVFLQILLQMTNRITEYTKSLIIEKIVYFAVVILVLLLGNRHDNSIYFWLILADLLGKSAAFAYILFPSSEIIRAHRDRLRLQIAEIRANITVGMKLMLANLASIFIIGIVRQCIESHWDVVTFGKVSLALSVSNLLMIFINAVAIVLFPMLKRTQEDRLVGIYKIMRTCLMVPLFGLMVLYYPMRLILSAWLPQYAESLRYMALLFPICIFESKMSMLIVTYMKALRLEKKLLMTNLASVALSAVLSILLIFVLDNLNLAIFSILLLVAFRCVLSECVLAPHLKMNLKKDIAVEIALVSGFVVFSWWVGGLLGLGLYGALFCLYLYDKAPEIRSVKMYLRAIK